MKEKIVRKVAKAHVLKLLVTGMDCLPAPTKTQRHGEHYQFCIAIGNDNTAFVEMTKEDYDVLMKGDFPVVELEPSDEDVCGR